MPAGHTHIVKDGYILNPLGEYDVEGVLVHEVILAVELVVDEGGGDFLLTHTLKVEEHNARIEIALMLDAEPHVVMRGEGLGAEVLYHCGDNVIDVGRIELLERVAHENVTVEVKKLVYIPEDVGEVKLVKRRLGDVRGIFHTPEVPIRADSIGVDDVNGEPLGREGFESFYIVPCYIAGDDVNVIIKVEVPMLIDGRDGNARGERIAVVGDECDIYPRQKNSSKKVR